MYVKYCETYQSWQKAKTTYGGAKKCAAKFSLLRKVSLDFERNVKKLLAFPSNDPDEQKLFTIMLAYAQNAKAEWMFENPQLIDEAVELCHSTIDLMDPYSTDVMGIYPLTFACAKVTTECYRELRGVGVTAKLSAFIMKAHYNVSLMLAWSGIQVFGIPPHKQSTAFKEYQLSHCFFDTMDICLKNGDRYIEESQAKVDDALKSYPSFDQLTKDMKSDVFMVKLKALNKLSDMTNTYMSMRNYKQALHLLSIAMHYSVKMRRELPPERRYVMNEPQSCFSHMFASFGYSMFEGCCGKLEKSSTYAPTQNLSYSELTGLMEPGVELYTSQFPYEHPDNYVDAKKVIKKALAWNNRSIELATESPESKKQLLYFNSGILSHIKMVDEAIEREKQKKGR